MANRFWVGGTGNWSDTTHWSTTTGGASGASVPTSADNVYFDALSFSATGQTASVNVTANCLDMDWTGATNNPTLAGSSGLTLNIYGSLELITGMSWTYSGTLTLRATSTGKTINTKAKTLTTTVTFNGVGGGWTLNDDLILLTSRILTLTNGSLNTNDKNISCATFTSDNTNTRSLTLGSSIITCAVNWTFTSTTGLTFNRGTSTIKMTGNTQTFDGGGLTYNNVELQGTTTTVSGSNTFNTLTLTAGKTVNITAGTTQTVTSLVANGASGNLITMQSVTAGSPATLSSVSNQTVDYCSIKDIAATGATFTATHSVNASGNSGWTFGEIAAVISTATIGIGIFF